MAQEITNFGRFYTALRDMSPFADRDEVKKSLVWQYTNGRTDSLKDMTRDEYNRCCADLEKRNGHRDALRKERSTTLKLMQKMGIDTTDWNRVNNLCKNPRIAGKEFARITLDEHPELRKRLRMIDRKGGLKPKVPSPFKEDKPQTKVTIIPISDNGNFGSSLN